MAFSSVTSKILICETDPKVENQLKAFCNENSLTPLKVATHAAFETVIESRMDIGGVLTSSNFGGFGKGIHMAELARRIRPELPIFFRYQQGDENHYGFDQLKPSLACLYTLDDLEPLAKAIKTYLFNSWFPDHFVRRVQEISLIVLKNQFRDAIVSHGLPYLVTDSIINSQVMSIIPIECNWCRGFMALHAESMPISQAIRAGNTYIMAENDDFRGVGHVIGEVTNMIWGALKNEVFSKPCTNPFRSQVPIIISHNHQLISFGTQIPQLCLEFTVRPNNPEPAVTLFERFVFNLSWEPERFDVSDVEVELTEAGDITLF